MGEGLTITSGCRCTDHNIAEGGSPTSSHLYGLAADIQVTGDSHRFEIMETAMMFGITRIGVARTFVHVDVDPDKTQNVMWVY